MRQHVESAVFGCDIAPRPRLARHPLAPGRGYVLLVPRTREVTWLGRTAEAMSLIAHCFYAATLSLSLYRSGVQRELVYRHLQGARQLQAELCQG